MSLLYLLVCGIGALNSLLLVVYLWFYEKGARRLNRLLAALVLTFSVRVSKAVWVYFVSELHPAFDLVWMACFALMAIVYYVYVASMARPSSMGGGTSRRLPGLAWFLGIATLVVPAPFLLYAPAWARFRSIVVLLGVALAVSLPLVRGFRRDNPGAGGLAGKWLTAVMAFMATIGALYAANFVVRYPVFDAEAFLFSAAVYGVVYAQLRSGLIGKVHAAQARALVPADDPALERLRHLMEVERVYLDPALSLPSLAKTLKVTPQQLSRLVNSGIGMSFNDYVNKHRVEEASRLLALPDASSRTIGSVAYDAGFNSLSVFYAAFRKFTGRKPSEVQTEGSGPRA